MHPRYIILLCLSTFCLAVLILCVFGRNFLHRLDVADRTVEYLDLARQFVEKRDYADANTMYEQAVAYAQAYDRHGETLSFALMTYADFAIGKLKDKRLAVKLQEQARSRQLCGRKL